MFPLEQINYRFKDYYFSYNNSEIWKWSNTFKKLKKVKLIYNNYFVIRYQNESVIELNYFLNRFKPYLKWLEEYKMKHLNDLFPLGSINKKFSNYYISRDGKTFWKKLPDESYLAVLESSPNTVEILGVTYYISEINKMIEHREDFQSWAEVYDFKHKEQNMTSIKEQIPENLFALKLYSQGSAYHHYFITRDGKEIWSNASGKFYKLKLSYNGYFKMGGYSFNIQKLYKQVQAHPNFKLWAKDYDEKQEAKKDTKQETLEEIISNIWTIASSLEDSSVNSKNDKKDEDIKYKSEYIILSMDKQHRFEICSETLLITKDEVKTRCEELVSKFPEKKFIYAQIQGICASISKTEWKEV